MAQAAWAQVFAMEPVSKPSCGVLLGAALNLFISAAGAGLLSFPLVCVQQGYLLCVVFTAACGWVNWFTLRILGEFASAGAAQLGASHVGTLDALSAAVFPAGSTSNARMYAAASFAVLVGCAGSLVGFLILIGDITSPLLQLVACPGAGCTQQPRPCRDDGLRARAPRAQPGGSLQRGDRVRTLGEHGGSLVVRALVAR